MDILTKVFTIFTQVMVKFRLEWEKNKKTLLVVVPVSLIIGILIGWVFFGRILFPVHWEDVSPAWLRADWKYAYLAAVAEDYAEGQIDEYGVQLRLGLNHEKSKTVPWTDLDTLKEDLDDAIKYAEDESDLYLIQYNLLNLKNLQLKIDTIAASEEITPEPESVDDAAAPEQDKKDTNWTLPLILVGLAAAGYVIWYLLVGKERRSAEIEEIAYREDMEGGVKVVTTDSSMMGVETRLEPFNTPYVFGDDYFDPSFSIEVGKNFLGECGIGISETIDAGDPKKVTAFEAWLFDKSDIRTITTILASPYATETPGIRDKLDPKGEVRTLEPGQKITLETTALRVVVSIKELEYVPASADVAPNSVFQKVNFELQAWVKPQPLEELDSSESDEELPLPGLTD